MRHLLLVALLLVGGCVNPLISSSGLDIRVDPNPAPVFKNAQGQFFIDIANKEEDKRYANVQVRVFDTGPYIRSVACNPTSFSELRKDMVGTTICTFVAGDVQQDRAENTVSTDIHFSTTLQGAFPIDVISQREYDLRKKSGTLVTKPKTYSFRDAYLQIDIELSDDPPLVIGKKSQVAYVTVRNVGGGVINELPADSVRIGGIVQCEQRTLIPIGAQFPRMTCTVNLPQAEFSSTHTVTVTVNYAYRLRKSTVLTIIGGEGGGAAGPGGGGQPRRGRCTDNSACDVRELRDWNNDGVASPLRCRLSIGLCCYGDEAEQNNADCRAMNA